MLDQKLNSLRSLVTQICVSTWVSVKRILWDKQFPREREATTQLQLMEP